MSFRFLFWVYGALVTFTLHIETTKLAFKVAGWPGGITAFCLPEISWIWASIYAWPQHGIMNIYVQWYIWLHLAVVFQFGLVVLAKAISKE